MDYGILQSNSNTISCNFYPKMLLIYGIHTYPMFGFGDRVCGNMYIFKNNSSSIKMDYPTTTWSSNSVTLGGSTGDYSSCHYILFGT